MHRYDLRVLFQHAERTCFILVQSSTLQHFRSLSTWPAVPTTSSGSILASVLRKRQWLHTSAAVSVAEQRKPSEQSEGRSEKQNDQHKPGVQELAPVTGKDAKEGVPPGDTSQGATIPAGTAEPLETDPLHDRSSSLFQRFKRTFKQYGKVMIPVHLVTSSVWFGTFYYAAMKGVNVVPFLEYVGLPDSIINILRNSQSGNALTAYAMYKIATPARYTVTLGGTSFTVKYLRKHGYMSTPPLVKDYIQDRMEETKERFTEKIEETKGMISEKMEETKDRISEKLQETKDRFPIGKKK